MLVKLTTKCSMRCSHCMEEALPEGEHMFMDTFEKTLSFIEKCYNGVRIIMLSGGEPTDHPDILKIIEKVKGWSVILLSNGMFLSTSLRQPILDSGITIQIYNDPRYYPTRIEPEYHPNILFANEINLLSPFGRAKKMKCGRTSPLCFNFRSCVRMTRSFKEGLMTLRSMGKMCSPSIDVQGNICAGESRFCHVIGTVESSLGILANNLLSMKCNKCGLENNLSREHLKAIYE
jgi:hypothetical protein